MTVRERITREWEESLAVLLEEQGLSLYRQGRLYQVTCDGRIIGEFDALYEVSMWLEGVRNWQEAKKTDG